jgi:glyoxylase-like metal-dependent hydrolase (beta-lactamase superfamily II)
MGNTNHSVHTILSAAGERTWLIDEFGLDTQYLLEGKNRALLIDTGTGVADLRTLVEKLTDKPYDVAATHGHNDHVGGSVQFPRMLIHPEDIEMVRPTRESKLEYASKILETYRTNDTNDTNGNAPFSLSDMPDGPLPELVPITEGFTVDLGNRTIEVIEVPGHTAGSIAFLDRKNRLLFSGDAFNPIFLLWLEFSPKDAAARFLGAAQKVTALKEKGAFTAMYGGHCDKDPLDEAILGDLVTCARGIVDGSITEKRKKIHIFYTEFYSYGKADITTK